MADPRVFGKDKWLWSQKHEFKRLHVIIVKLGFQMPGMRVRFSFATFVTHYALRIVDSIHASMLYDFVYRCAALFKVCQDPFEPMHIMQSMAEFRRP